MDREDAPEVAAPLDLLLADAAVGLSSRFRPVRLMLALGRRMVAKPDAVGRRSAELLRELARISAGSSELEPNPRDRRFADPAWTGNPLLHRVLQAYLAGSRAADQLAADVGLDKDERLRFVASNIVDALAPSNNPWLNPAAWKESLDTGGANTVRGLRAFIEDMSSSPRVPRMVDPEAYEVGRDLAVTPGSVVWRAPLYELIQFTPHTSRVHSSPLLVVPPTINKYYILDLAPHRSLIEFLVGQGHQLFVMAWRNPDARFRDSGLDAYGAAVVEAVGAVRRICRSAQANLMGVCSGGIITSMVMGHLAATGENSVNALTLLVTVLDQKQAGVAAALIDETTAKAAMAASAKQGYLDGSALAEVFAWLRPNDLVWNYWVNNYLLGRKPPAFDILFWNADTTRMPARMHHDFLRIAMANALVTPGEATMLDTPVDLGKIAADSYIVAGVADHICPWQSCYKTTHLLGGSTRFVLSTSGHIAALVNPADNPKSSFRAGGDLRAEADAWSAGAESHSGSWWLDYAAWLGARSGPQKVAPRRLGGAGFKPQEPAPGTYVFDR